MRFAPFEYHPVGLVMDCGVMVLGWAFYQDGQYWVPVLQDERLKLVSLADLAAATTAADFDRQRRMKLRRAGRKR